MAETPNTSSSEATSNKDTVVTPDDKQVLIDDLKKTMHDMGRIPAIIMAPIITYIASQYEKIPEGRRKKLQEIAAGLKTKGVKGLTSLKTWFAEASATAPVTNGASSATTPVSAPATSVAPSPPVKPKQKQTPASPKHVTKEDMKNKKKSPIKSTHIEKKSLKSDKKKEKKGK